MESIYDEEEAEAEAEEEAVMMNPLVTLTTMTLLALICACGDGSPLGDSPTIRGRIPGWNVGPGMISPGLGVSGPVDQAGNFSVTLPGAAALTGMLRPLSLADTSECTGTVGVSPSTVQVTSATFTASISADHGTSSAPVSLGATSPLTDDGYTLLVRYVFYDHDTAASGMFSCPPSNTGSGFGLTTTVSISASQGWNTELVIQHDSDIWIGSGPPPSSAQWTGVPLPL